MRTRILWITTLCFFITGCSQYRQVAIKDAGSGQAPAGKTRESLRVGQDARVTLVDGTTHRGEVMEIREDALVLGRLGMDGFVCATLALAEIQDVEVQDGSLLLNVMLGVVVTGFVLAAVLAEALSSVQFGD